MNRPQASPESLRHFTESVRRYAAQDLDGALESVRLASDATPDETLYEDSARYLEKLKEHGEQSVYTESDAFTAFISWGGNLPLYDNTRATLTERLRAVRPASLLDIGTGEGSIIVPVASKLDPAPALTFVEPSVGLLDRAINFAWDVGLEPEAYPHSIEDVLDAVDTQWEVAVATWSLHNLPPEVRAEVFRRLAGSARRLFVAEFDDPSGRFDDPLDPERIRHIHDRYRIGLREYPGEEGRRVSLGFLVPVMYGYFAREGRRSTYEQPIERWEQEITEAGFTLVSRTLIYPYWWADAYLIEAEARKA
jgi:ubiquinone/menaquinone biosynthesis C-methylase UbiE